MTSEQYKIRFLGMAILVGLVALNYGLFAILLDTNYLKWYLENGALIGLMMAFFALVWGDMNRHTGLISADPWMYTQTIAGLISLWMSSLTATSLEKAQNSESASDNYLPKGTQIRRSGRGCAAAIQGIFATTVWILVSVGVVAWMVVIAPLQYFVNLICGAPLRDMEDLNMRLIAHHRADYTIEREFVNRDDKVPAGWWDASLNVKPVSTTNLIATVLFLALNAVL